MQLSFSCDDIQDLVVKIYYTIDENKMRESSGIILRPKNETDYFFILTTRHSFKEEDNHTYKDVDVNSLEISKISLRYNNNKKFQPLKIIDTKHDLVVLIIKNPICKKYNLKQIKILEGRYKNCGIIGYPTIANNEVECFDKCTHTITQNKIEFKINANEPLQSTYHDEVETTKGYSGSGLFTQVDSNYMLTGIISEIIAYKNSFKCVNVSYLLKDISLDEYGGIEIVSLETIGVESSNHLHQKNNIIQEEYKVIIQEQVTKEFQALKKQYLDGSTKEIEVWIKEIRVSSKWNILANKDKAKIIYEEARISIELNQFDKTQVLINEIQLLDSSLYVNRLLSWIEIDKENWSKAISLLDNNEVATLNQKIAIYLDCKDFDNAKSILECMNIEDKNHETYRLQAIYKTLNNNLLDALKNINKSLELTNDYLEAKRVKAIILFYKSTLIKVLPSLQPPMMHMDSLKIDEESQKNVEESISLFNELIEETPYDRDLLWINCILWISNREKFIENIKELYKNKIHKNIAIQFIVIYNLDIDIDIQEDINQIESNTNLQVYDIDKLIRFYFKIENKEKVFELLNKYKSYYLGKELFPNWCEHNVNALFRFKTAQDAINFIDKTEFKRKNELKAQIYKNINDYPSAYEIYEELHKTTQEAYFRFAICKMKSEENSWEYITQYTDYLLENFQTEKVVELVILAEINSQHFKKANKLVDDWLSFIKNNLIKESFLRIKAICENIMGNPKSAIEVYERNNFMKSDEDIFNLSYLYRKTASYDKLEDLALKSVNNQNLHIDTKIQIASMVDNNSLLLKEIVKKNDIEKSNFFVIQNGSNIRLHRRLKDNEALFCWDGGEKLINFEEERQKKQKYTLYQNSDISTHYLDLEFFNRFSNANKEIVYTRSAKRFNFIEIDNIEQVTLFLDITSLLLLFSINMLDYVINSFNKVYLPSNIHLILKDINASNKLVRQIKTYFSLEKLFYSSEVNPENITEKEDLSNIMISIYTVIDFEKENSLVCVDDRYVNSFEFNKNKKQIISTNDILFTFYKNHKIEKKKYYSLLLEMRKRNYLYILMTSEEIIYHLKNCKIENNTLQISEDLKILKESLQFMVQNFKHIKSFTQEELKHSQHGEPFFIINQVEKINDTFIDLWNEEFEYEDDRYVYLTWIMDNLFTVNMSSLIQNKLSHNNNVSRTMSIINITNLFIQAIIIVSDKNQKLYFEWLYQNFLYRFFKANPTLTIEITKNIASMIIESFLVRERDNYKDNLVTGLIFNFPEDIKNRLFKNKELMDKLPFEANITIDSLNFENYLFIKKIKKVINGSKEEKVITTDEKNFIILKPIFIKNQKYITLNNNNEVLEDTYMMLSTSKQKRKKILESNPQWFNMSHTKKKEKVEEINNIKNHLDRIEKLYQVQEESKFYSNIQKDLEKRKLSFDALIPNNIEILLNHFRLDKSLDFSTSFQLSVETLLNEEDILKTMDTAHHFPISFPQNIINILKTKSDKEQKDILKSFLNTSSSPISHIQLIKVLISVQNKNFKNLILYMTRKFFTERFKQEVEAFFAVKNFIKQEFNIKFTSLNDDMKLALIWSHTNKLMKYFNHYHIEDSWIIETFKAQTNQLAMEIFKPDSDYNNDILNKSFSYEEFIFIAINYITNNNSDYFKDTVIETKLTHLLSVEDIYIKLMPPTHIKYNLTNSFLELNISSLPQLQNNVHSLEKSLLQENYTFFTSLLTLKYGFTPLEEDLQNQLIAYIIEYQPKENTLLTLHDLLLFTKQLKNINDRKIFKLIIQYIKDISMQIKTKEEQGILFEILIYLPIAQTDNLKKRIKRISKYMQMCNILNHDDIRFMVNRFLIELPLEYSNDVLPLKFNTYQIQKEN